MGAALRILAAVWRATRSDQAPAETGGEGGDSGDHAPRAIFCADVRDDHRRSERRFFPQIILLDLNVKRRNLFISTHGCYRFSQRAFAAFVAISLRRLLLSAFARATPPFCPPSRPSATAARFFTATFFLL